MRHHALDEFLHGAHIAVRLVDLERSEFRVVRAVEPFVAEVAVHLVDTIHPADDQALQVKLGGNAHKDIDVERVVVRLEGLGGRSARNLLEHRGLDLVVAARIKEVADFAHDLRAFLEDIHHFRIGDEIERALAVAGFHIGQAMEFFRKRQQRLGKQCPFGHSDGILFGPRDEQFAFCANYIAEIEQLEGGKIIIAENIFLHHKLEFGGTVRNMCESHFSHFSDRHDPSAYLDLPPFFEGGMQFVEPRRALERLSKGGKTSGGELIHVFNALLAIFVSGCFFAHDNLQNWP